MHGEALVEAAARGDAKAIFRIATRSHDSDGVLSAALLPCFANHRFECVEELIQLGADINASLSGTSLIAKLCDVGPAGAQKGLMSPKDAAYAAYYLIHRGALLPDPMTLCLQSCAARNAYVLQVLVDHCIASHTIDVNHMSNGVSLMMLAIHPAPGHTRIVALLLSRGFDVNSPISLDEKGESYSALHVAMLNGDVAMATYLLGRGANPNVAYPERSSLRNITVLMLAAERGNLQMLDALLSAGADIHYTVKSSDASLNGSTAVLFAFTKRHYRIVRYLLDHGATLSTLHTEKEGELHPFAVVIISGHEASVAAMCSTANREHLESYYTRHGCLTSLDKGGINALDLALLHNRVTIAEMLFRCGVDPRGVKITRPCVAAASAVGKTAFLDYLVTLGARPPSDRDPTLIWVAEYGSDDDEDSDSTGATASWVPQRSGGSHAVGIQTESVGVQRPAATATQTEDTISCDQSTQTVAVRPPTVPAEHAPAVPPQNSPRNSNVPPYSNAASYVPPSGSYSTSTVQVPVAQHSPPYSPTVPQVVHQVPANAERPRAVQFVPQGQMRPPSPQRMNPYTAQPRAAHTSPTFPRHADISQRIAGYPVAPVANPVDPAHRFQVQTGRPPIVFGKSNST